MSKLSLKSSKQRLWNEPPKQLWKRFQVRAGLKKFTKIDQHIWCLSTGRVGTKTVAALGSLMPSVLSEHEPQPLFYGLGKQAYEISNETADQILIEAILASRWQLTGLNQTTYLETSPHVTFLAAQLNKAFPNSKFIHIIRNPIDVVNSGVRRKWYCGNATDKWQIKPLENSKWKDQWNEFDAVEKNIWSWAETNRWISNFLKTMPADSKMQIKSEDLFAGNQDAIQQLFEFCGETLNEKSKVEKVLDKKLNANRDRYADSATPNDWSEAQIEKLDAIAGEVMKQFGYEITRDKITIG